MNHLQGRSRYSGFLLVAALITFVCSTGCHDETPAVDQLKGLQVLVVKDPTSGKVSSVNNLPSDPALLDEAMQLLPQLNSLNSLTVMDWVPFTDAHMAIVGQLSKVSNLDIAGSKVTDTGIAELGGLSKLGTLNVAGTQLTTESMKLIGAMSNLDTLNIAETQIDGGYEHLKGSEKLKWLVISDLRISDEGAQAIAEIPNLTRVSLQRAEISPAGIASIRAKGNVTIDEGGAQEGGLGGEVPAAAAE